MKIRYAVCAAELENARRVAARLASQRITEVEVGPRYFVENDEKIITAASEAFRSEGVAIYSIHAPFRRHHDLGHEDDAVRQQMVDLTKGLLRKASLAGASIMVVHPGGPAEEEDHSKKLHQTIKSLEELVPIAEQTGVTIALENLPPDYPGSNGENLRAIMRQIDSSSLGICFDTGHANMTGEFFQHFQMMKDHIVHFHVHDNNGNRDNHLPPPYGTINWDAFYRLLRTMNYEGVLTLECSPWEDELGNGAGMESDFVNLLDQCEALFTHLEARIRFEEQQRAMEPAWRLPARAPHWRDMQL